VLAQTEPNFLNLQHYIYKMGNQVSKGRGRGVEGEEGESGSSGGDSGGGGGGGGGG